MFLMHLLSGSVYSCKSVVCLISIVLGEVYFQSSRPCMTGSVVSLVAIILMQQEVLQLVVPYVCIHLFCPRFAKVLGGCMSA